MRARSLLMTATAAALLVAAGACEKKTKTANDEKFDADAKSGADGKRSGAKVLKTNTPVTDEVNFLNQDRSDWFVLTLKGRPGVLNTVIHWDSEASDVMIDVFDEFGKQISASPVRNKGAKEKALLTQIDKTGTYFVRVTAPSRADGTVYTMEAKWEEPREAPPPPVASNDPPPPPPEPRPRPVREPRPPREPKEKPTGETVQGRVVSAYREGAGLTLHIDKGSAAGVRTGATGNVLLGPAGEDLLEGAEFKVVQVLGDTKCVGKASIGSIGKNTRVVINLGR
jgi:hypothetical protein